MSAHPSQCGEPRTGFVWPPYLLLLTIGLMFAIRIAAGGLVHLTEDEAYYRLWSITPAFGYYDHPPMIAWWVWLGRRIAGDDALGVRLLPIVSSALTSYLVFDIALFAGAGRSAAVRAGVWYNSMVLVIAGGFLAVPDSPAALFWTLTLSCCLRAVRCNSRGWWVAAGLAAGLAALSKYSSLFLVPGVFLWLVSQTHRRRLLSTSGPWLAVLAAAMVFSFNVLWNADHQWLTFAKQFGRIAPSHWRPAHLPAFLVAQMFLLNPLVCAFLAKALSNLRSYRNLSLLFATSAPFLVYLVIYSLHDSVQAHWPAPVYPALAVCAAVAATGAERRWLALRRATPWIGFAVVPLLCCLLILPIPIANRLAAPVLGWPDFARRLEQLRLAHGAGWIGVLSYGLDAQLSSERAIGSPIYQLSERARYDRLDLPKPDFTRPGLLVDLNRRVDMGVLQTCFERVMPLGGLKRVEPSTSAKTYAVFLLANPKVDLDRQGCDPPH